MATILVIDDEASIHHAFQKAFKDQYILQKASTCAEATAMVKAMVPDVIVLDVRLPDATGLETFHALRQIDTHVPIILITGHGTTDLAIDAMKHGAFDYLSKPLELSVLREQIDRAVRSSLLMRTPITPPLETQATAVNGDQLVGQCPAMQEVYKAIGRVAGQDVTVLILGESGTGKELIARAIYQHSQRSTKPFLAINCGAIPETLIESELFGHEKGAFTGADKKRIGKFEQCDGGTLFLDEIAELPPLAQVKLLRVLQEGTFERVGGTETIHVNVRILAATNAELDRMTLENRFRKDLYFRLNGFIVTLPPLRDRGEDLNKLIEYYLLRYEREAGKTQTVIPEDTLQVLQSYPWPGNVRELQSVIRQALLQMSGSVLLPDFLPAQLTNTRTLRANTSVPGDSFQWDVFVAESIASGTETLYAEALVRMEREVIMRILKHTNGNQLQAARILGITRGSLRTKIRTLGISIGRAVWTEDDQSG